MRVTQNMLNSDMLRNITKSYESLSKLQNQLSTGKKVTVPSDDPVAAVRGMYYRSSLIETEQFQSNTKEALSWMDMTDSALSEVTDILQKVRELTVQGSNGTNDPSSRTAIADEIEQLNEQLKNCANSSIAGRYIFGGTSTQTPPYDKGTDTWNAGNSESINVDIGVGVKMPINIPGQNIFGTDNTSSIFKELEGLVNNLKTTSGSVDSYLGTIDSRINSMLSVRAGLGSKENRIELAQNRLDNINLNTNKLLSEAEDVDIAKVIMDLKTQENVHRSALAAGSQIIMPTLVDFLK